MSDYAVAHLDEIEEMTDGRCPWRPVRFQLGIKAFGVNAFTGREVGDRLINEHDESEEHDLQEELYLVQQGRATFELDGERVDAPAGTFVFVRPAVRRTAFAEEPGTTIVAVGGVPGKAYEAHGGELWLPVHHLYESGRYAEAADQGRESIEAHPEYRMPLYNLACCESLAGRTEDAIKHLGMAVDGSEQFRAMAAEDSDFDPIRDEAAFKELISSSATEPTN
jgi:mannose-6-phosphate isomerase-like protein (cupin superfamily)